MSLYTKSVITELRQKTANGFDTPIKLGAEQRYIGPLLNSHNNNLEEQTILGVDCLSITWEDNGNRYTTKKFYNGNINSISNNGYYILFNTEYNVGEVPEFEFGINSLILGTYESSKGKIEQQIDGSEIFVADSSDFYSFDNITQSLEIKPSGTRNSSTNNLLMANNTRLRNSLETEEVISKEVLCIRVDKTDLSDTQSNTDIVIAIKTTTKSTNEGKTYIKQSIVNYLNN